MIIQTYDSNMKLTLAISFIMLASACSAAPAPVISREHPVQLVVLTTKALKSLGVQISGNALHSSAIEGLNGDDLPVHIGHPQLGGNGHHVAHHNKVRHSRHRFSSKGCPRGWKKDATGKCRRIW
ncbi:Hypothetical protein NTJ_08878 [Nesidiocoris tenuis]|uniref:Uncharacterized protein n=1 Tax=Nesidiocoris tenuis TaxID=355587 RepID=A0ABN7AV45_9HEMI|nr:Hypothetical protein NTJ_08878 [Nesidiocoris tenuis]